MRRALRAASGFAASLAITYAAGCTFLVSFDDMPREDADAASPPREDAGLPRRDDAGTEAGAAPDTCDSQFPLSEVQGCGDFQENGQVCADNPRIRYPDGRDGSTDVVTCTKANGGRAVCVKHCTGPGGCAHLPDGFPDQCDPCTTKPSGTHCGSEMVGWPSENYRLLITCGSGRMTARAACERGCDPKSGTGTADCR